MLQKEPAGFCCALRAIVAANVIHNIAGNWSCTYSLSRRNMFLFCALHSKQETINYLISLSSLRIPLYWRRYEGKNQVLHATTPRTHILHSLRLWKREKVYKTPAYYGSTATTKPISIHEINYRARQSYSFIGMRVWWPVSMADRNYMRMIQFNSGHWCEGLQAHRRITHVIFPHCVLLTKRRTLS